MHSLLDRPVDWLATRLPRRLLVVAVVLLPTLLAAALPLLLQGKPITAFLPNYSDEIIYWREIKAFVEHGFSGGQYSTNELPAAFAPSPFGSHGPAFIMLYGIVGKLFGWEPNSAIFLHLVMVPLATWFALRLAKPDAKQLLVLLALLLTWWPLYLYIPALWQEVLHMCMALVLAGLFYRYVQHRRRSDGLWIAAILLLLIPFRLAWAFVFFPLVFLAFESRPLKALALALLASGFFSLAGVLFVRYFYSSYPWFSSDLLDVLQENWRIGLLHLADHFVHNLGLFFAPRFELTALMRYQLFALLAAAVAWLLAGLRRNRAQLGAELFHVANLGAIALFVLLFYDIHDTRDYRMFIAPMLLSAVLWVWQNRWRVVLLLALSNLLAVGVFAGYYAASTSPSFNYDPAMLREVEQHINPQLVFRPGANRWCNTIAVGKYGGEPPIIGYALTQVPAGFGISTILDWDVFLERPLLSQYVWLYSGYEEPGYGDPVRRLNLFLLAESELGDLYRNPHAPCE